MEPAADQPAPAWREGADVRAISVVPPRQSSENAPRVRATGPRPLRVGLIAPPWVPVPPPAYGGTEAVLDTLSRGLVQAGHEVTLFTTGDSTSPVPRRWTYETAPHPTGTTLAIELEHARVAYQELSGHDVIHDHTLAGPFWAAAHPPPVPVVVTNHLAFTPAITDALARLCAPTADLNLSIVAISHDHAARSGELPIRTVIHHGVEPDDFPVGRGDGGYALFVGRLHPDKGIHIAIEIARRAGLPIRIAAKMREPVERQYFAEYVEPLLGPGVEFLGEVRPDQRNALLGGATALVNPIQWAEPFGMVMIEALACGTPVLAYPHGAAPEIVQHGVTGFLCGGVEEAAAALARIGDLDRSACRAAVERYFCARRMVDDHVRLYRRVQAVASSPRAAEARHGSIVPLAPDGPLAKNGPLAPPAARP